jgi:hypothetical protein
MAADIRNEGGAMLQRLRPNSHAERQKARRWCASQALAAKDPHKALRELLHAIGLQPQEGEQP